MASYWFKPRRFGLGATPVTWQGWTLVLGYLAVVGGCVAIMALSQGSPSGCAVAAIVFVVATAVALRWSWLRTDGDWRWRWGGE